MSMDDGDVEVDYTNHRGERRLRRIRPLRFFYGANEWHPVPGHMCYAMDLDGHQFRYFALSGVHSWRELRHGGKEADHG